MFLYIYTNSINKSFQQKKLNYFITKLKFFLSTYLNNLITSNKNISNLQFWNVSWNKAKTEWFKKLI